MLLGPKREGRTEKEEERREMGGRKEGATCLLWQSRTLEMALLVMKPQLSTDL